jgi:carbonic anhydrase
MCNQHHEARTDGPQGRRGFLRASGAAVAMLGFGGLPAAAQPLTRERRDAMTPDEVIAAMKAGNQRFRSATPKERDLLAEKRATAGGQYPKAVLLSCIDSRAPAEAVLDMGLGDIFNTRLAGTVVNEDVLGGMEFACAVSGSKVVLVMGHTACGAVRGAIDDAKLGNLTALLAKIKPAVAATTFNADRSAKNPAFVDAVARKQVELAVQGIRRGSPVLADLEKKGTIKIVGSMYDLRTGAVDFLA